MARATFHAQGITTLAQLQHFLGIAVDAGFPSGAEVSSPASGIAGASVAVSTGLSLLPDAYDVGGEE